MIPESEHVDSVKCAICHKLKGDLNRWWYLIESVSDRGIISSALTLQPFESGGRLIKACYVCGLECTIKVVSEWMRQILDKEESR